jgi:hypothetical protein
MRTGIMTKELWIECYEDLVNEFMEQGYSAEQAERLAEDGAQDRYRDRYADMIDAAKDRAKAEGNWPPRKK